jgi:regulator of protease activity HflC (stomatin/prohibitin superfamily)
LQHDPLLPGAYLLNPFLLRVELTDMLVVQQGEVAVIKSYVGLPTADTSGEEFKFGSIVQPGHQGIWSEPLRTGKYPLNPHCYGAVVVPTSILTLNWADASSQAHNLDVSLSPIDGKSREGFEFFIDLQVQIHVPDTKAPKVISMVGTMQNLVNEVLQSAVGNYFRNTLQGLAAVAFIETRDEVQHAAEEYIKSYLGRYEVETRGVYIQDVDLPEKLVEVLQAREIANQQKATFEEERAAQDVRVQMEKSKGLADRQSELAASEVAIAIASNQATARKAEADGVATFTKETGQAEADVIEAKGVARAAGYKAQVEALGEGPTALVAVAAEVGAGHVKIVPDVLVAGSGTALDPQSEPRRDPSAGHAEERQEQSAR